MKKLSILTAIAPLAIISCVNDTEIVDKTSPYAQDNSIAISPFVGNSVKSGDATDKTLESGIMVYAYETGTTTTSYFGGSDAIFSKSSTDKYWISTPVYFWPSFALDFYGYYPPATFKTLVKADAPTTFSYTVPATAADQLDLVAAVTTNQTTETSVPMTFYHALSKVAFTVENYANSGLSIKINSIGIENIANSGDFTITKTQSIENFYTVTPGSSKYSPLATLATPQTVAAGATSEVLDSMYLIPQTLSLWAYSETVAYPLTGTYILLDATITEAVTSSVIYDGKIAVPFTTKDWIPGYYYKYNIVFGDYTNSPSGGGGYNPDKPSTNPDDKNKPQKILLPIEIDAEVIPWKDVDEPNIIL